MTQTHLNHWGDQPSESGLLTVLDTIESEVGGLLDLDVDFLDVADRKTALVQLDKLTAMQHALSLRLLAGGDQIGTDAGNRDASVWLTGHTGIDPKTATGRVKLAKDLDHTWTRTATVLSAGEVSVERARVIVAALNRLTTSTEATPEHLALAEKTLLDEAGRHGPASLVKIGKRILEVIDPARFEAAEGEALAKEEAAALRKLFFHIRTNGDGTSDIHARVATVIAERLRVILEAYTNLRRRPAGQKPTQQTDEQACQQTSEQSGEQADVRPEPEPESGPEPDGHMVGQSEQLTQTGAQPDQAADRWADQDAHLHQTPQPSHPGESDAADAVWRPAGEFGEIDQFASTGDGVREQPGQKPGRESLDPYEDPGQRTNPPGQPDQPDQPHEPDQPSPSPHVGEPGEPGEPGQSGESGSLLGQRLPPIDQLRGEAFAYLLEHLDPDLLPRHGGDATTLIVNIPLQTLTTGVGAATLGYDPVNGERISAGEARRLACNAGIIPVVLGGESGVLDLGRTQRVFNAPQRKAFRIRDQHCCAEDCTVDATWCDAHHWEQWAAHHGATDLKNGGLLCPFHHRRAHDPRYRTEFLANGTVRFHRHD